MAIRARRGGRSALRLRRVDARSVRRARAAQPEQIARNTVQASRAVLDETQTGVYAAGEAHPPDDERLPSDSAQQRLAAPLAKDAPAVEVDADLASTGQDEETPTEISKLSAPPSAREMAEAAVTPRMMPLYNRSGRLVVPPPLRGSREILVHQNRMADAAGLERIQNDSELDRLRAERRLVNLADTASLHVNPELPSNRRCARPWTARFAENIARAYYVRFGQPLELSSAVRTITYQAKLQRVNGNAAALRGETASPHLTGQAIDFGKSGMSMAEIAWMRAYLLPLMNLGVIDVEEEFQQACFHISVYRGYLAEHPARRMEVAQVHHRSTANTEEEPASQEPPDSDR
jgi:hypothetical protein